MAISAPAQDAKRGFFSSLFSWAKEAKKVETDGPASGKAARLGTDESASGERARLGTDGPASPPEAMALAAVTLAEESGAAGGKSGLLEEESQVVSLPRCGGLLIWLTKL